jgi:BirA family biotin operon repressor/biotin-[acetyl-CoA-carboxylase] ligase
MNPRAPAEQLLAVLVAHPNGAPAALVRRELGESATEATAVLRNRGHAVEVTDDTWRLACARQHFDPAAFEAARTGGWGAPCEVWEVASSTNDLAREGALGKAPDGALWVAECQTAGRGRQGRNWTCAPHAGLLASWIVRGSLDTAARPTLLPLAVGLGLCEGLRAATGLPVRLKWPNDLWLEDGKLGGVLVEARPGPHGFAIAGVGLNFVADAARDAAVGARTASLHSPGVHLKRESVLAAALAGAERRVAEWRAGRNEDWLEAWRGLDTTRGRSVHVQCGDESVPGRAIGVSATGCLRLVTGDGTIREFAAGEVHLQ